MILIYVLLFIAIYYFIIKPQFYWRSRNVLSNWSIPFFGDTLPLIFGVDNLRNFLIKKCNDMPNVRFFGIFQFMEPVLIVKSPEVLKQICVKDFDHFLDRKLILPDNLDELISKNLVQLKDQKWKIMRATLSPSFTSSKMKAMFDMMSQNAVTFTKYFMTKKESIVEVEVKDAFARYTNDVIATTGFGLQVDSLSNRDNDFYLMGRDLGDFSSSWKKFVLFLYYLSPALAKFLGLELYGQKTKNFFLDIVQDTIKMREEKNINRSDMLGLLLDARKGLQNEKITEHEIGETGFVDVNEHSMSKTPQQDLTETDIGSQVFIFFLGGFETVSTAMCFMAYELATNPDVQKKLIEEIDESIREHGAPTYESIANMVYLNMVVCETLRKWPATMATDRAVTKPYTIKPESPDEKPVHLEVGDVAFIPISAIHYDPKYYNNPEKFIPERFSPENRKNINPYAYLPFGLGPRNCIGSRFALLEIKTGFFQLLSQFEIVPVEKTDIPIKLNHGVNLSSVNGYHLGLKKRKTN